LKVAITNSTGLRNRGVEALVVSLIQGLKRNLPGTIELDVHTNDPSYDKWRLEGVATVRPSYLTLTPNHPRSSTLNRVAYSGMRVLERLIPQRLAGFPIRQLNALHEAELVLPTGGDIITSDYANLRKHLSSIVGLDKKKAALIGHTIGPFTKADEAYFRKSLQNLFLITVRESESFEYLKSLNLDIPLHLTADVAFGLTPAPAEVCRRFLLTRYGIDTATTKLVSLSVSEGVIRYSKLERSKYFQELTEFVNRLNARGYLVILIPHVTERNPNNNDLIACEELHSKLMDARMCRIISGEYSAAQLKGIIGLSECLLGARTHATIAAMSQGFPTVSVAYSRKAYGIMSDVFGPELGANLTIAATDLSADALESGFERAMASGEFSEAATRMKQKAELNYTLLADALRNG
jgi:colanic acid/amylovoran biosynthesis protein